MTSGGKNFSRTLNFNFQDFPGSGILKKKNPGLSRRHGNPVFFTFASQNFTTQMLNKMFINGLVCNENDKRTFSIIATTTNCTISH